MEKWTKLYDAIQTDYTYYKCQALHAEKEGKTELSNYYKDAVFHYEYIIALMDRLEEEENV